MGGLVVATLLTLVFLPALYVAWFKIKPQHLSEEVEPAEAAALAPA
jgi:multidrug efflux pump